MDAYKSCCFPPPELTARTDGPSVSPVLMAQNQQVLAQLSSMRSLIVAKSTSIFNLGMCKKTCQNMNKNHQPALPKWVHRVALLHFPIFHRLETSAVLDVHHRRRPLCAWRKDIPRENVRDFGWIRNIGENFGMILRKGYMAKII